MKKYVEYMDNVKVSDTLHRRLAELEAPVRQPAPWKKYGAAAAALALVLGLGGYGVHCWNTVVDPSGAAFLENVQAFDPEIHPDIALVDPSYSAEPGQKVLKGYDVGEERGGVAVTVHYVLPYIEYGDKGSGTTAGSLAEPAGGLRGVTENDVRALLNWDARAADVHLNWGGCTLDGSVGFEANGDVWMMAVTGQSDQVAFTLEMSLGRLPPACLIVMNQETTVTKVWGVEVTGIKDVGSHGDADRGILLDVSRRVEFIAGGVGCRFTAYGTDSGEVEEFVSRFVRWAVIEGLDLDAVGPDGVKTAAPAPASSTAGPGGAMTSPYNPEGSAPPVSVSARPAG